MAPQRCFSRFFVRPAAGLVCCLVWLTAGAQSTDTTLAALAGMVKRVSGTVMLERGSTSTPVLAGTLLRVGDRIVTGSPGGVGIVLADDTLVTAGPGSRVEVSDMKFDATTHEGHLFIRLFKGALHFVTGLVGKNKPENVKIETPTAVMGVRGTEFIVQTAGVRE